MQASEVAIVSNAGFAWITGQLTSIIEYVIYQCMKCMLILGEPGLEAPTILLVGWFEQLTTDANTFMNAESEDGELTVIDCRDR